MYWSLVGIYCLYFHGVHGLKAQAVFALILVPIEKEEQSVATIFIIASLYFKTENQFRYILAQAIIGRPLIAQNYFGFQAIIPLGEKVLDKVALVKAFLRALRCPPISTLPPLLHGYNSPQSRH
jgi:hypothetical protein